MSGEPTLVTIKEVYEYGFYIALGDPFGLRLDKNGMKLIAKGRTRKKKVGIARSWLAVAKKIDTIDLTYPAPEDAINASLYALDFHKSYEKPLLVVAEMSTTLLDTAYHSIKDYGKHLKYEHIPGREPLQLCMSEGKIVECTVIDGTVREGVVPYNRREEVRTPQLYFLYVSVKPERSYLIYVGNIKRLLPQLPSPKVTGGGLGWLRLGKGLP